MWNYIFILLIINFIASCSNKSAVKIEVPQTKQECIAINGNWINIGLPGTPKRCDIKTNDGGNTCTDTAQCQGECIANNNAVAGSKATGKCSDYIATFNCYKTIEKGIAGVEICAD